MAADEGVLAIEGAAPAEKPAPGSIETRPSQNTGESLSGLLKQVNKWTLHSDRELHLFLKSYSADLFARTKALEDQVRDIAMDADTAQVRLKNTFNQFLMLSNIQFIENRVYDEDQEHEFGEDTVGAPKPKTDADAVSETPATANGTTAAENGAATPAEEKKNAAESVVTKYRSALEMGLEAMKLFAVLDDDDDDDASESSSRFDTVLDIYNERPLPFIIGTREFLEDETLGLGAAPIDESDVSSDGSDSDYGSSYSSSDESEDERPAEPQTKRRASKARASSVDSDESDGLFGRPADDPPNHRSAPPPAAPGSRPRPQFANIEDDDEESDDSDWSSDEESVREKPTRKAKSQPATPAASDVHPQSTTASQGKKKAQFFDSSDEDSEDGLFGAAPKAETKSAPKTDLFAEQSSSGLFDSNKLERKDSMDSSASDDVFGSGAKSTPAAPQGFRLPPVNPAAGTKKSEAKRGFFSDSESDAESTTSGLFGRTPAAKPVTAPTPTQPSTKPPARQFNLSDDSDDDDDDGLFGAAPTPKPVAAPSAPKPTSVPPTATRPRPTLDSDDDSDDSDSGLFGSKPKAAAAPPLQSQPPVVAAPRPAAAIPQPKRNVFDDDDDSDESDVGGLFGATKPATRTAPPPGAFKLPTPSPQPTQPVPAAAAAAPPRRALSDSDDDDDDGGLFGAPVKTQPKPQAAPVIPPPMRMPQASTFSDSSDAESDAGGLFGVAAPSRPQPVTAQPPPRPVVPQPQPTAIAPPPALLNARQASAARDDDSDDDWSDDDDGGLFGRSSTVAAPPKPAPKPVPAPTQPPPQPSLFAAGSESSAASLFGPSSSAPATAPATSVPAIRPPIPNAAARFAQSDDDDSDSDWDGDGGLFGAAPKK